MPSPGTPPRPRLRSLAAGSGRQGAANYAARPGNLCRVGGEGVAERRLGVPGGDLCVQQGRLCVYQGDLCVYQVGLCVYQGHLFVYQGHLCVQQARTPVKYGRGTRLSRFLRFNPNAEVEAGGSRVGLGARASGPLWTCIHRRGHLGPKNPRSFHSPSHSDTSR